VGAAVRVTGRGRDGRQRGLVDHVVAKPQGALLGIFKEGPHGAEIRPFDPVLGDAIHVPAAGRGDAEEMHAVRFEIARGRPARGPREARVLESLGHIDVPGTDSTVVALKYGLARKFPRNVLEAAKKLPEAVPAAAAKKRERFDDPAPVTIDGETAQDFDDAIAVARLPKGGFRLFVHIADVSHFVTPDSVLDAEALRRGTSVYFPGRVLPMFPEQLSNELCSLKPGVDRLVQSAIIDLNARGKVARVRFADGVIRSAARLTYTAVGDALDGNKGADVPKKLLPMLRIADELRDVLEKRRHARGSVDFDLPEPQILLDVEGVMTGITVEPRNHAHRMIEEFMLLANEAVAGHLQEQGAACMYRVHDQPSPEKLETFANFVKGFGLSLQVAGGQIEPDAIQTLIEQVEGQPEARVISQVALRSMQQARYSMSNSGHFGLAAPVYCHFTSPIRRYPDLVVHRQLRALRNGGQTHGAMGLGDVAEQSSTRERNAEAAERELLNWKKVAFIEGEVGNEFDGVVTGVPRFGLFVQLVENLAEGLLHVDRLGDEWFEHDADAFALTGSETKVVYRLGDKLRVRVDRVDRLLRRVDLSLVNRPAIPQKRRGPRRGRRR
jgi:ribonuclease R